MFKKLEFKDGDGGDVMEETEKCCNVMAFHLTKMKLTERILLENPFRMRNGKRKLDQ